MTTKQVINIHNFLVIQQNHWFVYLIAYLLISISQQSYKWPVLHSVIWFFLGMLPFLFYKIREKVRISALCWVIYLPFLIIDMVVASILMSMGMMMLPPSVVSLPFKVVFFVLIDGWYMLAGSLINSFH